MTVCNNSLTKVCGSDIICRSTHVKKLGYYAVLSKGASCAKYTGMGGCLGSLYPSGHAFVLTKSEFHA